VVEDERSSSIYPPSGPFEWVDPQMALATDFSKDEWNRLISSLIDLDLPNQQITSRNVLAERIKSMDRFAKVPLAMITSQLQTALDLGLVHSQEGIFMLNVEFRNQLEEEEEEDEEGDLQEEGRSKIY